MEMEKKKILVEILKKQFEESNNFKTDNNLKNEELIQDVKAYLDENGLYDFIDTDIKHYEIKIYFVQGKQCQAVILKYDAEEKFVFDLTKNELFELIK